METAAATARNSGHSQESMYFPEAVDPKQRAAAVEYCCDRLRDIPFDSIVVTGYSGAAFGSVVAHALGKALVIVRKPTETANHSGHAIEGNPGQRFVIIDDFISSGATVRRILDTMADHCRTHAECVGFCGYNRGWWRSVDKIERVDRCNAIRVEFLG